MEQENEDILFAGQEFKASTQQQLDELKGAVEREKKLLRAKAIEDTSNEKQMIAKMRSSAEKSAELQQQAIDNLTKELEKRDKIVASARAEANELEEHLRERECELEDRNKRLAEFVELQGAAQQRVLAEEERLNAELQDAIAFGQEMEEDNRKLFSEVERLTAI